MTSEMMDIWPDDADFSKNDSAGHIMGYRNVKEGTVVIDLPCELGYVCPVCKVVDTTGNVLQWSEYDSFLWCASCNLDIPSALCVPLEAPEGSPWHNGLDYQKCGIGDAIDVFLSSVKGAQQRFQETS